MTMEAEFAVMLQEDKHVKDSQPTPRSQERRLGWILPHGPQEEPHLPTL